MKSKIAWCHTTHVRNKPKKHSFGYKHFLFALDLDEIEQLHIFDPLVSTKKSSWYRFCLEDHYFLNHHDPKRSVLNYLAKQGQDTSRIDSIKLVTNLRTMGFVFNPISIYLCLDHKNHLICSVAEVTNTFWEQKLYYVPGKGHYQKNFYISPFMELESHIDFNISLKNQKLNAVVKTKSNNGELIVASMKAELQLINLRSILRSIIRFPFMPQFVWLAIHKQALMLWLKKIPYIKKDENLHMQKEILHENSI